MLGDHAQLGQQQPLATRLTVAWLLITLALLPIKFVMLPHNVILVDFWIAVAMGVFWLAFLMGRQTIIINPYFAAMWLILVGSVISTFASPSATRSLIVVVKEMYLFAWFVTMTVMLSRLSKSNLRLFLLVWLITVLLHGLVIIAEFVSPSLWHTISEFGGQPVTHDNYRPSGFFITPKAGNANKAAFFQILGFLPLILTSRSKRITVALGIVLFCSILATGSMGATIAFGCGLLVGVMALVIQSKDLALVVRTITQLLFAVVIIGSLLLFAMDDTNKRHFQDIIFGRAEKSSGGRLDLWQRRLGSCICA